MVGEMFEPQKNSDWFSNWLEISFVFSIQLMISLNGNKLLTISQVNDYSYLNIFLTVILNDDEHYEDDYNLDLESYLFLLDIFNCN